MGEEATSKEVMLERGRRLYEYMNNLPVDSEPSPTEDRSIKSILDIQDIKKIDIHDPEVDVTIGIYE